jgi:hypothetical protein
MLEPAPMWRHRHDAGARQQPRETAAEIAGFIARAVAGQSASGSPNQPNTEPSNVTMSATAPPATRRTSIAIGV